MKNMEIVKAILLVLMFTHVQCMFSVKHYVLSLVERSHADPHDAVSSRVGSNLMAKSRLKRDTEIDTDVQPIINNLHIESRIASRFAETVISSELENLRDANVEARFVVQIPETAFISNFSMVIDGDQYIAEVKSKEDAQKAYDEAVEQNKTAGQVAQKPRTPLQAERGYELFTVNVNVKANSLVHFKLEYQQLLQRKYGLYENRISVRPNQIVQELRADIYIYEPQGISELEVIEPTFSNSVTNVDTQINDISDEVKQIAYQPSAERQQVLNSTVGVLGDLVIRYDVNHANDVGLIQIEDDYFVHFFSPAEENLAVLGKNIIFVIDISGSMSGRKMTQTRNAMLTVLDQLNSDDRFMLLLFDDQVEYWPGGGELSSVSPGSIRAAKAYAEENLEARGNTGINMALVESCEIIRQMNSVRGKDMIVFLTDGQATYGETNSSNIIANTGEACGSTVSIFSLGFGFYLDFELLQKLAYKTKGFAKRIYEAVDAETQLKDFFKEISKPLIYNIDVSYPDGAVDTSSLTAKSFAQYFQGSELIIAGKIGESELTDWDVVITGQTTGPYEISSTIGTVEVDIPQAASNAVTANFIEKLYVYMKIKDLLKEELISDDSDQQASIKAYALQLALDYGLVTPLTSMIIVESDPPPQQEADRASFSPGGSAKDMNTYVSLSGSAAARVHAIQVAVLIALASTVTLFR